MNDSTEGKQARLSPGLKRREEMKLKEYVSILPQKESPSARFSRDGSLLALTLLLALVSCCLTVVSFCRVAALQAELRSLREELLEHQAEQLPGPPRAGAAAPRATVQEAPAATSALKVSSKQLSGVRPRHSSPHGAAPPPSGILAITWVFSALRGSLHHQLHEKATSVGASGRSVRFRVQKNQVCLRHRSL